MAEIDIGTGYSPLKMAAYTCEICGKPRHTGNYNIRHVACAKLKKKKYEQERVDAMAEKLSIAIDKHRANKAKKNEPDN